MQFLTAINNARDLFTPRKPGFADFILGQRYDILTSPLAYIGRAYGVAVREGKIYVCDFNGGQVKVFDLADDKFYILGGDATPTTAPTNLCIASDGYKFVVEPMPQLIQVFDPQDNYVTTFKVEQGRPGGIVAIGGELFVLDVTGDRILVLDRGTGKLLRTFGSKGSGPGQFAIPNSITADADGNLYVTDLLNFRFQKLDRNGKSLMSVGKPGDTFGEFGRPRGIALAPDGVIYVVETSFQVVEMFNQQGQVLMAFGNSHAAPGFLEVPASIAVDKTCMKYFAKYVDRRFEPEYLLFVTSQIGVSRLGVYAFGHLKPGAEIPPVPVPAPEPSKEQPPAKPDVEQPAAKPGTEQPAAKP